MFDKRNIRIYYLKTLERIRSFLLSRNSREFLIFLFFVFVSFCFWLLQVLNDDYETEFSVPLRLKNVPSDVVLTSELPDELRIQRAMYRDGASEEQVRARIAAQMDDEEKRRRADFTVVNDGVQLLIPQLNRIVEQLKTEKFIL